MAIKECVVCGGAFDAVMLDGRHNPRMVTCSKDCQRVRKNMREWVYFRCVQCGDEFKKMGKTITCSDACRVKQTKQTDEARRIRKRDSGENAEKQRAWRRKNPNAPCLVRQRERYKNDPVIREIQKKWVDENREVVRAKNRNRYWNGGKEAQAERYARIMAAYRIINRIKEEGLSALL